MFVLFYFIRTECYNFSIPQQSERTVQNAKRNMGGVLGARRVGGQWYNFIKKKQPPEPAS